MSDSLIQSDRRRLGRTDLLISPIGLGGWGIGGPGYWGLGPQSDDDSIEAIEHAVGCGLNWIDTAPVYGFGHSEEVVGRALQRLQERPYLFTKCGFGWDEDLRIWNDLSAASVRREVEASRRRLGVDVIDLIFIHQPLPDRSIEEGWSTLAELKAEGEIRFIGVSNFDVPQMRRAQEIAPIDCLQPRYSLIHPDVEEEILPFCGRHGIGVVVYSPLASGLLSGHISQETVATFSEDDYRRTDDPDFREPLLSRNLALVSALTSFAGSRGLSLAELAVAWTLQNPAVTGAIVGFRRRAHVDALLGVVGYRFASEDLTDLRRVFAGAREVS